MQDSKRKISQRVIWITLLMSITLGSCAASMTLSIDRDGSGILAVDSRIPDVVAERLQSYRSSGGASSQSSIPLFSIQAIKEETAARGMTALIAETPSPNRFRGSFSIRSLSKVAADPVLSKAGLIQLDTMEGVSTLSFSLSRKNAEALSALFPGIDPYILEALSPPALDPYPVSLSEYREMLLALLGESAMKELDAATAQVQIRTPGPITRSVGGSVLDQTFSVELRLLDLLVLEKPIAFSVSWT